MTPQKREFTTRRTTAMPMNRWASCLACGVFLSSIRNSRFFRLNQKVRALDHDL